MDSEHKKHKKAVTSPELVHALDDLDDAIVIFDPEWRYLYINKAGYEALEMAPADVIGKTVWEFLPQLEGSIFKRVADESMKTGVKSKIDEYYLHADKYYQTKFYPSKHMLTVHITDITDLVRAQQLNEQLMGSLQSAMDVYWSKENQNFRQRWLESNGTLT